MFDRRVVVVVFGLALASCGNDGGGSGDEEARATLTLEASSLVAGHVTQASVRDGDGLLVDPLSLSWSSSDESIAAVTERGTIVAQNAGVVSISASPRNEPTLSFAAELAIAPPPLGYAYFPAIELAPAVLALNDHDVVSVIVDGTPTTTGATLTLSFPPYDVVPMRRIAGSTRFQQVLSARQVAVFAGLAAARSSLLSCFSEECGIGHVEIHDTELGIDGRLLFANMPLVPDFRDRASVTVLDSKVQATDYVVNIRDDGDRDFQSVTRKLYRHFADVYEYVAISELSSVGGPPIFRSLRNRTTGIGAAVFDVTAEYGASPSGAMLGFISFPRNTFDLGHVVTSHEMGHAFMCRLDATALGAIDSHWPQGSTTAFGVMGSQGRALTIDRILTPLGDGRLRVDAQTPFAGFNDLELYLFGLADASEVGDQFLFADTDQSIEIGSVLEGPATRVTIDDIIATVGPRVPAWTGTPVTFRLATIVISRGRLLTPLEMRYYDQTARNGEATESRDGGVLTPFSAMTRGRGILVTRLDPPLAPAD